MQIICCRCGKEYTLQGNLFEAEIANKPVLKCPHCGSLHLVDFIPTKKDHSGSKLSQLKLGGSYYVAMGGSRICSATRVDLSGADDVDVVKPAADDFIVAVNINSAGKDTVAAQYKLRWRDYGEVAGTYHFDTSDAGPTDTQGVWTDDAYAFDGLTANRAHCSTTGSSTLNALQGDGTNAPASGDAISDVRVRIYGYNGTAGDTLKAKVWLNGRTEVLGTVSNTLTAAGWSDWLTLDAPDIGGWTWAKVQALEVDIYTEIVTTGTGYVYKVEIDVMKNGSAFADVGATGEIHYNATTDLVNGAAIAVGGRKCDSQGGDTWQAGEEVEGASLCDSIDLVDEYETEIHFALDSSGAEKGHVYEFELWDSTNDASRGTLGATVRIADEVDSYGHANFSEYTSVYSGYRIANAQSFTCDTAATLDSAVFYARKAGSPTGNVYAKVYAHSGTYGTSSIPTGSVLATSDAIDISTLPTGIELITFIFSGASRISLSASTYYTVVIEFDGGDSSNLLSIGMDSSSPTHDGNRSVTVTGASWEAKSEDLIFGVYGIEAAGTTVSDTRFARTAGKETTTSERLARTQGKETQSSERLARTSGGEISSSTREARTAGIDTLSSERLARTTGSEEDSSEREARTAGIDTLASERAARTAGIDTLSSTREVRTHGKEIDSSIREARTAGGDTQSSERYARTEGSDGGTQVDDTREARTHGKETGDSERMARTAGVDTQSDEREARTRGGQGESSEREARTAGIDTLSSEREARTQGSEVDNSERYARTHSKEIAASERYARTEGYAAGTQVSSTRDACTAGIDTTDSERLARTAGSESASDTRDARTVGQEIDSSEREARTAGKEITSSEREARTSGGIIVSSEREARTYGKEIGSSERYARTEGKTFLIDLELPPVTLIIADTLEARLIIADTLEARLKT